jgi:hypothetical protein
MTRLTIKQQLFLVDQFATFASPAEALTAFAETFGFAIEHCHAAKYNPDTASGLGMAVALRARFDERRQAFIDQVDAIPIAHRAYRIRRLHEMEQEARRDGDRKQAAALIEQAAKELGGGAAHGNRGLSRARGDDATAIDPDQARVALADAIATAIDTALDRRG